MNTFDLPVFIGFAIAVFSGFSSGLLRSAVTILASGRDADRSMGDVLHSARRGLRLSASAQRGILPRRVLRHWHGSRQARAHDGGRGHRRRSRYRRQARRRDARGALRVGLVATLLVLVFDRIIPPRREPAFLAGSQLRRVFSEAGKRGFRSLPPRSRRSHRPAEIAAAPTRPAMHFGDRPALTKAGEAG